MRQFHAHIGDGQHDPRPGGIGPGRANVEVHPRAGAVGLAMFEIPLIFEERIRGSGRVGSVPIHRLPHDRITGPHIRAGGQPARFPRRRPGVGGFEDDDVWGDGPDEFDVPSSDQLPRVVRWVALENQAGAEFNRCGGIIAAGRSHVVWRPFAVAVAGDSIRKVRGCGVLKCTTSSAVRGRPPIRVKQSTTHNRCMGGDDKAPAWAGKPVILRAASGGGWKKRGASCEGNAGGIVTSLRLG